LLKIHHGGFFRIPIVRTAQQGKRSSEWCISNDKSVVFNSVTGY